jgi:A118 family predicted phage portal protein
VAIEETPWNMLDEEATVPGLESPLFAPMQMPNANNHDIDAPIPVPITADALAELEGLDIAFSRFTREIYDSKRLVLLDSDRVLPAAGNKLRGYNGSMELARNELGLPDMVKNVWGDGADSFYQEINPALNTDTRILGMNAMLSQIGYKCGFSNGYFTFNEKASKVITATQVEADQQRTIQFVKDCRDQFERAMHTLIKALDEFADLYGLAPAGSYDVNYNFGDILYSYESDKQQWWKYVLAYKVPAWMYFVKFEGMTEEDAKAMQAEMDAAQPSLFEEE